MTIVSPIRMPSAWRVEPELQAFHQQVVQVTSNIKLTAYTVAALPSASASGAGALVLVSNEAGGAVVAFSDGTNWRRVTDRAVVT